MDDFVSILVLVDLAHESAIPQGPEHILRVSILVLVDLAHEFLLFVGFYDYAASFNPCFSGSCSRMLYNRTLSDEEIEVSILVLVDLAHELTTSLDEINALKQVSILVLVDLAHEFIV